MKYVSTRSQAQPKKFCDILLEGLAPDGGLYMPEHYPDIRSKLDAWRTLTYGQLAFAVMQLFIDDINKDALKTLVERSYSGTNFDAEDMVSLRKLENNLFILGLSHGPTLAFKDMAMQLLGNLFEYVLEQKQTRLNILGATSGDTGSAAEYALKGKKNINVFMMSPFGKMSAFQTAQMYSLQDKNIFNLAIQGVFDDCQDIVKAVSQDHSFKTQYNIGSVNSINWARVLAQVVYYIYAYLHSTKHHTEQVSFCVPTGNFGNICAAHIAKMMGLPIQQLVLATNENDVLHEFFSTGCYRPRTSAQTQQTSSPSMDISKASNFERFIFDVLGKNAHLTRELFETHLKQQGYFTLTAAQMQKMQTFGFSSGASNHDKRIKTIAHTYKTYKELIDPHSADAMCVALIQRQAEIPMIVVETAMPAKFSNVIEEALGMAAPVPKAYADIEKRTQRFHVMRPSSEDVKAFIAEQLAQLT